MRTSRDGALVKNDVGSHTLIHALHDDDLGYVFDRLRDCTPGAANLIVLMPDDATEFVALVRAQGVPTTDDTDCPVSRGSHVGMLVQLLVQREGKPVMCRLVAPTSYQAELAKPGRDDAVCV